MKTCKTCKYKDTDGNEEPCSSCGINAPLWNKYEEGHVPDKCQGCIREYNPFAWYCCSCPYSEIGGHTV